jgi:hypothetical protein
VLGEDALCLVDDPPDELGLEDVQAGSHRRSIMPDRWCRPRGSDSRRVLSDEPDGRPKQAREPRREDRRSLRSAVHAS